ncbi:MAG: hypothetical protein ACRCVV_22030 [Shewanella sp.]
MKKEATTQELIEECKERINKFQEHIDRLAAFERMADTTEFKAIIEDEYFTKRPVRLVMAKGNPSMESPDKQASLIREMDGIAMLRQYFYLIHTEGAQAAAFIERELEQIRYLENEMNEEQEEASKGDNYYE